MATLLDLALKVTLLLVVSGAIVGLMQRGSAASRHVALTAALGAAVLLPAARWTLPALPLFVLTAESTPTPVSSPLIDTSAPITATVSFPTMNTIGPVEQPVADIPVTESVRASRLTWSWAGVIGFLWLLGTTTILARMTVAAIRIRKLSRDAQPTDDVRMTERLLEIKKQFGVARPVTLIVSAHEWMPLTWGLRRPTILLPSGAAAWTRTHPARLDAVLLHEMAHIARWDAAWHSVARVAVALFWFNPLVWIAARRARLERERACDDAVLARGLRATDYASDLLLLAQTLVLPPRAAGSALAMARHSQLEQRVGALLDGRISRRRASRISRLLAVALITLMLPMSAAQLAARPLAAVVPSVVSNGARGLRTPGHGSAPGPESQPTTGPATSQPPSTVSLMNAAASLPPETPPNIEAPPAVERQQPSATIRPGLDGRGKAFFFFNQEVLSQPAKWMLERDAMFRLLIERARNFVKDGRTKIEIGTVAVVDMKPLEDTLAFVEVSALDGKRHCATPDPFAKFGGGTCVNGVWTSAPPTSGWIQANLPTDAQIADVKTRFTEAMRNLDFAEVRWDNGLATTAEVAAALRTAVVVLTGDPGHAPAPGSQAASMFTAGNNARALYDLLTSRVSSVNAPLTDTELLDVLKGAASVKSDVERANTLLELATHYAFTPEMVTLYVAAAKGITSGAQQIRVFAQPIRVK